MTVNVNGQAISMEFDTGASISIASRETFEQIREGELHLELEQPTIRLQTYTGESIKVCGSMVVKVTHNGQTQYLPLDARSGPMLLGRNWLEALRLDMRSIFHVGCNLSLVQVLSQHAEVFKEGLGELQGAAAKIHINATLVHDSRNLAKCLLRYGKKSTKSWSDYWPWKSCNLCSFQTGPH